MPCIVKGIKMREDSLKFLETLVNTPSPSGFEERASEVWREYVRSFSDNVRGDALGNSIATINSGGFPKLMLCGHLDEIGMMVHYINDDGFLNVSFIGGQDTGVVLGQRIIVHNKNGPVFGVMSRAAVHLLEDDEEVPKIHEISVDIGAVDKEDAQKLVSIGDPITFDLQFRQLRNNRVVARGFDDCAGAWAVAEALRILSESDQLTAEVVGVATVGEENGFYGAYASSYSVNPLAALVADLTHTTDTPHSSKEKHGDTQLGKGPVMAIGSITNRKVRELLVNVAEEKRIPLQRQACPVWSGTDADAIFVSRSGVATGLISIPNRYMHTPVEIIHLEDLENTAKLLAAWCEAVKSDANFNL